MAGSKMERGWAPGGGQREWLEYDEEEKVMFCTWCKKYEPKAKSVWCNKGTPILKLESVKEHENSTTHRKSVATEKAARNPTTTPAAKTLQTLNRLQMERMTISIILPYSFRVFLVLKHFYGTPENVVNLPKMLSYAQLQRKFPFHFFSGCKFHFGLVTFPPYQPDWLVAKKN